MLRSRADAATHTLIGRGIVPDSAVCSACYRGFSSGIRGQFPWISWIKPNRPASFARLGACIPRAHRKFYWGLGICVKIPCRSDVASACALGVEARAWGRNDVFGSSEGLSNTFEEPLGAGRRQRGALRGFSSLANPRFAVPACGSHIAGCGPRRDCRPCSKCTLSDKRRVGAGHFVSGQYVYQ